MQMYQKKRSHRSNLRKPKTQTKTRVANFANGRSETSPDCEQIKPARAKLSRQNQKTKAEPAGNTAGGEEVFKPHT